MLRQGDVLLVPISADDVQLMGYENKNKRHRKLRGLILAEGEATGHHHRVLQRGRTTARIRTATVRSTSQTARVLTVPEGGAELVHDEHDTIKLEAGMFLVQGQREFVPPTPATPAARPSVRAVFD